MQGLVSTFVALSIIAADCWGVAASADPLPRYEHIFLIILENRSYEQIIGNPSAPNINRLAMTYGLASQFYAEVHPSEGNYVAMVGGDTFPHWSEQFGWLAPAPDAHASRINAPTAVVVPSPDVAGQEQMARDITQLQAAEQDVLQKISEPLPSSPAAPTPSQVAGGER